MYVVWVCACQSSCSCFRLELPDGQMLCVKVKPTRSVKSCLEPILSRHGFPFNSMIIRLVSGEKQTKQSWKNSVHDSSVTFELFDEQKPSQVMIERVSEITEARDKSAAAGSRVKQQVQLCQSIFRVRCKVLAKRTRKSTQVFNLHFVWRPTCRGLALTVDLKLSRKSTHVFHRLAT